jgi:hypothetical protein
MNKRNRKRINKLKSDKKRSRITDIYSSIVNPPLDVMKGHFSASDKMRVWWNSIVEKVLIRARGSFLSNLFHFAYLCKLIGLATGIIGVAQPEEGTWAAFIIAFAAAFLAALIAFIYHLRGFVKGFFHDPRDDPDTLRERINHLEAEVRFANEERDSANERLSQIIAKQEINLSNELWNSIMEFSSNVAPVLQVIFAGLQIFNISKKLFFGGDPEKILHGTNKEDSSEASKEVYITQYETPQEEILKAVNEDEIITPFETPYKNPFKAVKNLTDSLLSMGADIDPDDLSEKEEGDSSNFEPRNAAPKLKIDVEFLGTPEMDLCRPKTPAISPSPK